MADLKVGAIGGSLECQGHNNQTIQELRNILGSGDNYENRSDAQNLLEKRNIGYDVNYQSWVPVAFRDSFEIAFHGFGGVMSLCDMMITDSAEQMPWPFADDIANEGIQVDEAVALNLTGTAPEMLVPRLGAIDFSSGFARISKALLANSPFDIATLLGQALGERLARIMERRLTSGIRGSNQFGGFLTRSAQGCTTPIATPVSLAKLRELIWSVIGEHRNLGTVVMHDTTLAAFAGLVDTTGQPLLNIGNGRLQYAKDVSVPYRTTNYMKPVTGGGALAAADKLVAFGNFWQMKVRVVRKIRLERFNELFAEFHQAAFLANRSADADLLRGTSAVNCPIKTQNLT
jgi:HK97 family phage major capsid protein